MTYGKLLLLVPSGDAATIPVKVSFSGSEDTEIGTVRTIPVKATPSFTDYFPQDFGSFDIKVTPSGTDIQDIHDANTIPVKVTNLSVETPQFGLVETPQWYVDVQFSAAELYAHQYSDSGSAYVDVRFTGDDCYNVATPDFEVDDYNKWLVTENAHWSAEEIGKKWNVYEVVGDFDNSCFAATVA